jgi:menaquinone-dependent protoporphyrinogen oxidase
VSFAGALQYREYDFVTRLVMRVLMRRGDHPTDVTEDYDYTDWDDVERFGRAYAALLE